MKFSPPNFTTKVAFLAFFENIKSLVPKLPSPNTLNSLLITPLWPLLSLPNHPPPHQTKEKGLQFHTLTKSLGLPLYIQNTRRLGPFFSLSSFNVVVCVFDLDSSKRKWPLSTTSLILLFFTRNILKFSNTSKQTPSHKHTHSLSTHTPFFLLPHNSHSQSSQKPSKFKLSPHATITRISHTQAKRDESPPQGWP